MAMATSRSRELTGECAEHEGQTRPWNSWKWNDKTVWSGDIERGKELRAQWEAKKARDAQKRNERA